MLTIDVMIFNYSNLTGFHIVSQNDHHLIDSENYAYLTAQDDKEYLLKEAIEHQLDLIKRYLEQQQIQEPTIIIFNTEYFDEQSENRFQINEDFYDFLQQYDYNFELEGI